MSPMQRHARAPRVARRRGHVLHLFCLVCRAAFDWLWWAASLDARRLPRCERYSMHRCAVLCNARSTRLCLYTALPACKFAKKWHGFSRRERIRTLGGSRTRLIDGVTTRTKISCLLDGAEVAATAVRATGAGLDATDASHDMASPRPRPLDAAAATPKEQNLLFARLTTAPRES